MTDNLQKETTHCSRLFMIKSGFSFPVRRCKNSRVWLVQTARVLAPARLPAASPDGASSMTRPAKKKKKKQGLTALTACPMKSGEHLVAKSAWLLILLAPTRYAIGWGFPWPGPMSSAVMTPRFGRGKPHLVIAAEAYPLDAARDIQE